MLGRVFGTICIISFLFASVTGRLQEMSNAVLDGASGAVKLTVSLVGIMCLWCGLMRVFSDAGLMKKLSRFLSPLLRVFFPTAYKTGRGAEEIAANISANLLGIGNAATPAAIEAMKKMQQDNEAPESASPDMITLAVLNTASVSILPSTLIAIRRAAGSLKPFAIVVPVWICSIACALLALALTRVAAVASLAGSRRKNSAGARRKTANKNSVNLSAMSGGSDGRRGKKGKTAGAGGGA